MSTPRIEITKSGFSVLKNIIEMAEKYVYLASFLFSIISKVLKNPYSAKNIF